MELIQAPPSEHELGYGLQNKINKAKAEEAKERARQDGIKGNSLLSASGMGGHEGKSETSKYDFDDVEFIQMPKGQDGLQEKINKAKADEAKERARQDGIKGNSLLSSAGMGDHQGKDETSKYDFDDVEFIQRPELSSEIKDDLGLSLTRVVQQRNLRHFVHDQAKEAL